MNRKDSYLNLPSRLSLKPNVPAGNPKADREIAELIFNEWIMSALRNRLTLSAESVSRKETGAFMDGRLIRMKCLMIALGSNEILDLVRHF